MTVELIPMQITLQETDMYVLVVLPAPAHGTSNQTVKLSTYDTRPCPPMNDRTRAVVRALLETAIQQLDDRTSAGAS